jgi:hypothetical protein
MRTIKYLFRSKEFQRRREVVLWLVMNEPNHDLLNTSYSSTSVPFRGLRKNNAPRATKLWKRLMKTIKKKLWRSTIEKSLKAKPSKPGRCLNRKQFGHTGSEQRKDLCMFMNLLRAISDGNVDHLLGVGARLFLLESQADRDANYRSMQMELELSFSSSKPVLKNLIVLAGSGLVLSL